jgi:hypothetical protein
MGTKVRDFLVARMDTRVSPRIRLSVALMGMMNTLHLVC